VLTSNCTLILGNEQAERRSGGKRRQRKESA
jgi:hypothetical protein